MAVKLVIREDCRLCGAVCARIEGEEVVSWRCECTPWEGPPIPTRHRHRLDRVIWEPRDALKGGA